MGNGRSEDLRAFANGLRMSATARNENVRKRLVPDVAATKFLDPCDDIDAWCKAVGEKSKMDRLIRVIDENEIKTTTASNTKPKKVKDILNWCRQK